MRLFQKVKKTALKNDLMESEVMQASANTRPLAIHKHHGQGGGDKMPEKHSFKPDDSIDSTDIEDLEFEEDLGYTLAEVRTLLEPEFLSKIRGMLKISAREDEYTRDESKLIWQAKLLMDLSFTVANPYAFSSLRYGGNIHFHLGEGLWLNVTLPRIDHNLEIQPATITAGTHQLSSCQAVYAFLKSYVPINKQYELLWDIVQWYRCFIEREWHRVSVSCDSLSELLKPFNEQIRQVLDGKQ